MSTQMKYSCIHFSLWIVVTILFLYVFLSSNTIENWGDNRTKTVMLAILFGIGFLGDAILRYVFRDRKKVVIRDERDAQILNKSLGASFVVTIVYVFLVAIILYTNYEASGLVPVAWLWFIAYSLILVANISTSALSIIHYRKSGN